jgi:hypothetical protein
VIVISLPRRLHGRAQSCPCNDAKSESTGP